MIVVDTNVIAYLYVESEFTRRAERQLTVDADWAAPLLWRSEFRNVLAGAIRRNTITFADARQIMTDAESLLTGAEHEVSSHRVLEMVRDSDCSAYDCEFVVLASQLGVKLVTMDAKLLKAFPKLAIPLPSLPPA